MVREIVLRRIGPWEEFRTQRIRGQRLELKDGIYQHPAGNLMVKGDCVAFLPTQPLDPAKIMRLDWWFPNGKFDGTGTELGAGGGELPDTPQERT